MLHLVRKTVSRTRPTAGQRAAGRFRVLILKSLIVCPALIFAGTAPLAAAPQQLFGKSVVVAMTVYTPARADNGMPVRRGRQAMKSSNRGKESAENLRVG